MTTEAVVLNTPEQIGSYRALVIASALSLYAKTGMRVNRAYTPAAMLKAASGITGKAYKRGQYQQAATDLREFVKGQA